MLTEKITEEIINAAFTTKKRTSFANRDEFSKKYIEPVTVVDEDDNIIGIEYSGLCHSLGLRHEAVFVLCISPDGKMLVDRKEAGTNAGQDILDVAVGGHAGANEDAGACAIRKIKEKFHFNPLIGHLKLIASYNRNTPIPLSNPREINNERRFLFKYFVTDAEMAGLSETSLPRDKKDAATTFDWRPKEDIVEAINMSRTTDELLTCFLHYLLYKLPDSEIKIG
jgi:hypothetical protein